MFWGTVKLIRNHFNNMIKEEYGFRKKENIDAKDDSLVETLNVD